ncbi:MAG: hypothetical protein ABR881_31385 [Candidatus Sulfotelmatobacter sp.]|jgi:hypothetical protein
MFNESAKQQRNEIGYSSLWEEDGQEFYWDDKREIAVQPSATPIFKPDYAGAVEMLVKDKKLRDALSPRICRTLEMVFRKLAAGVDANEEVIPAVAGDINRDERTVRRHLSTSRKTANDLASASSKVMNIPCRPRFTRQSDGGSIYSIPPAGRCAGRNCCAEIPVSKLN